MKKQTIAAITFMIAAIVIAIPLGINRTLLREREDAANSYYYDKAGYSISEGLEARRIAANDLITLAERYKEKNPDLGELIDSLDYYTSAAENAWSDDETFTREADANAALDEPAQKLAAALNETELSDKDKKYPDQLIKQMKSEQDKINRSSYNSEAQSLNARIDRLEPMAVIKKLAVFGAPDSAAVKEAEKAADMDRGAAVPEAPEAPEAPDAPSVEDVEAAVDRLADGIDSRAEEWADGLESRIESGIDGLIDNIFG